MKIVMICSGGLDSTVLYYYEKSLGNEIIPIIFPPYGSKHNKVERERAKMLIPDLKFVDIDLSFLGEKSSLSKDKKIFLMVIIKPRI